MSDPDRTGRAFGGGEELRPLPGEFGIPDVAGNRAGSLPRRRIAAIAALIVSLVAAGSLAVQRLASGRSHAQEHDASQSVSNRPAALLAPKSPEIDRSPQRPVAPPASAPMIPALIPTAEELAEPSERRRHNSSGPSTPPADAPVMILTSRHPTTADSSRPAAADASSSGPNLAGTQDSLAAYQRNLQSILDGLTRQQSDQQPGPSPTSASSPVEPSASPGLFGGQLQRSATPTARASVFANRSLTIPKGTSFTCALKTRVISAVSGLVGCTVQYNVYGDDGRVLLLERGSHVDGEYRITTVKPGMVRIPVLWTRVRTPLGVAADLESPATGQLGESGIDGHVDNRWIERIGSAMLLSIIDDAVQLTLDKQGGGQGDTVVLPSAVSGSGKLAEKVLDSTINIPPLIYQNQGSIVGVYVARDLDFSSVYVLQPADISGPAR